MRFRPDSRSGGQWRSNGYPGRLDAKPLKEQEMTRVDANKYSVLIRGDYLYALSRLSANRQERDRLIQEAVESFLDDCTFEEREKEIEIEVPRLRILFSPRHKPSYHIYLEFVRLPDDLVALMDIGNRYPDSNIPFYDSLGTVLNAAIRVFLKKNHPEFLVDRVRDDPRADLSDHA